MIENKIIKQSFLEIQPFKSFIIKLNTKNI